MENGRGMNQSKQGRKKIIMGAIISFGICALLLTVAMGLAGLLPGGDYRAVYTDSYDQMAAFSAMLARHIRNGESIFYSWETSLGQNTALIFSLCAYSPVTFLFLLIPDAYYAMVAAMIVKLALAAACMYLFLASGITDSYRWNIFFALAYGMCGFAFEYLLAFNLLDLLYMIPLIMAGILHSMRNKKFVLLTIIYALCFVAEMYCAFLAGVYSAIALVAIFILKNGKCFLKNNLMYLLRYGLCVLNAALLSMILLLPAILCYFNYPGFNMQVERSIPALADILYAVYFGRPTSLKTEIPFLYCSIPVLLLLPLYFMNVEFSKKERIVTGTALIAFVCSFYVDPLYMFFHLFNRPEGFTCRYAPYFVFTAVALSARMAGRIKEKHINTVPGSYFLIQLISAVMLIICHDKLGEVADGKGVAFGLYGTIILMLLYAIMGVYMRKYGVNRWGCVCVYFILCVELTAQAYFNCCEQGREKSVIAAAREEKIRCFSRQIEQTYGNPAERYRTYIANVDSLNKSAMYGYMGIGQFSSSNYSALYKLMARLGNGVNAVQYTQSGATDVTDMIFGVKWRGDVCDDGLMEKYGRALPMGYMVSADILDTPKFDGNVFENQNKLLRMLCGEEITAYTPADIYDYFAENAVVSGENGDRVEIRKKGEEEFGSVLYGIPKENCQHAYAYFKLSEEEGEEYQLPIDMGINTALYSTGDRKGNGMRDRAPLDNAIIEMTADETAFLLRVAVFDDPERAFIYRQHFFYYQQEDVLDQVYEQLKAGGWKVTEWEQDHIRAEVFATEDAPVLFMTIPYDKGWQIKVDDENAEILPVLEGALSAIQLSAGEHEIKMDYVAPGRDAGRFLFVMGIIVFMVQYTMDRSKKNEKLSNVLQ